MRLIDADKLVEICRKGWKLFGRDDEKLKHWVDENDIREQPTVKAIPIEWIVKYMASIESETKYAEQRIIQYMLEEWKKENEIN